MPKLTSKRPGQVQSWPLKSDIYYSLKYFLSSCLQFLAMVFQDLLTNKDDYLRASRALLREIIKQTKHEINFQSFCFGLMQERKEPTYVDMEFKVSISGGKKNNKQL